MKVFDDDGTTRHVFDSRSMSYEQRAARIPRLRQWRTEQAGEFRDVPRDEWPQEVHDAWALNDQELGELESEQRTIDDRYQRIRDAARGGPYESGDGRRVDYGGGATFGRARQVIESAVRSRLLPDHPAEAATGLVEQGSLHDRSFAACWAVVTGDPDYLGAFQKLVVDPQRGHLMRNARARVPARATDE